MIRAVISDFGGVLTSPLAGSFQAFADRSGITLAAMGTAFASLHARDGRHPLHELECGRMTEIEFVSVLQAALRDVAGRDDVTLTGFAGLLGDLLPNEPMIALMASLRAEGYRMALLTNNVREWEQQWRAMARQRLRRDAQAGAGDLRPDGRAAGGAGGRVPARRRPRGQLRRGRGGGDERGALPRRGAGDGGDPRGARWWCG